jgi:hypothetical protein
MSGGASAAAGGAGAPPAIPLASLARVKADSSLTTEGDRMLAAREFPRKYLGQAYCHNTHGLTVTPDTGVVSPTTHEPVGELMPIQVPPGSAYVSAVLVGKTMDSEASELEVFYNLWEDRRNAELFKNIGRADAEGDRARAFALEALAPMDPVEPVEPVEPMGAAEAAGHRPPCTASSTRCLPSTLMMSSPSVVALPPARAAGSRTMRSPPA